MLKKLPKLKALWLNDNPISQGEDWKIFQIVVEKDFPNIEILNTKFTRNAGEWAVKYATFKGDFQKISETPIEKMKYIDVSGRNFLGLEKYDFLAKMKKLRILDLRDTFFDSFAQANRFFLIFKTAPHITTVYGNKDLEEMIWSLKKQNKLSELCPSLEIINDNFLSYQPLRYVVWLFHL